jgi:hypothetical protein
VPVEGRTALAKRSGDANWYALYPLHQLVFAGMLKGIARTAMGTG